MAVKSIKTDIIDWRPTAKPTTGAKIKNVDGSTFTEVSDFDRESKESTQKINNDTGYFGKTIQQINEG
mgnify:CR=1 FL=1|tara:strand:- start:317 stop:520 length:204 start_codon:yes stop_codon:yes gene_type:complete